MTLHAILSAESAGVLGVLRDFHLLDGFTEGSAVTGAVLADNTNLLSTLGHVYSLKIRQEKEVDREIQV